MTARCPEPACPVRYSTGGDRRCSDHSDTGEGVADRLAALAGLTAAPEGMVSKHDRLPFA